MTEPDAEASKDSLLDQILRVLPPDEDDDALEEDLASPPRIECPKCRSYHVLPLVYGLPSSTCLDQARQGLLVLGGCSISVENPAWQCAACRHEWGNLFTDKKTRQQRRAIFAWIDKHYQPTPEGVFNAERYRMWVQPFLDQVLPQAFLKGAVAVRLETRERLYFVFKDHQTLMQSPSLIFAVVEQLQARIQEQTGSSPGPAGLWVEVLIRGRAAKLRVSVEEATWTGEDNKPYSGLACTMELGGLPIDPTPAETALQPIPVCRCCGEPLRTDKAKQCWYCGTDWHDPKNVVRRKRT